MVKIGSCQHISVNMTTKYSPEESYFQSAGTFTQRKRWPAWIVAASSKINDYDTTVSVVNQLTKQQSRCKWRLLVCLTGWQRCSVPQTNLTTSFLSPQSLEKTVGTFTRRNNQSRQLKPRETTATDDDISSLSYKHPSYHRRSNQGLKTSKSVVKYSGYKSIFYTL